MKNETTIKVPKKYASMIRELVVDFDGYRNQYEILAEKGFMFAATGTHIAFEETQADALKTIRTVSACTCKECVQEEALEPSDVEELVVSKIDLTKKEIVSIEIDDITAYDNQVSKKDNSGTIIKKVTYSYASDMDSYISEDVKYSKIKDIDQFIVRKLDEGFIMENLSNQLQILKKKTDENKIIQYLI